MNSGSPDPMSRIPPQTEGPPNLDSRVVPEHLCMCFQPVALFRPQFDNTELNGPMSLSISDSFRYLQHHNKLPLETGLFFSIRVLRTIMRQSALPECKTPTSAPLIAPVVAIAPSPRLYHVVTFYIGLYTFSTTHPS